MTLRLHPDASAELDATALWYEQEQPGLGRAFLVEVTRAMTTIQETPSTWPLVRKQRQIRRFLLARFPFAILYQADAGNIVVLAVAHTKRRPHYWRARRLP